jgi:perosamine synthetase
VIPVSEPLLAGREREYVDECLRTGWISSSGRFIGAFESAWATYCDRAHGIAVSNGTVALQLAIAALNLDPGDEVIIPTFTIISCATAVVAAGGVPVLVDADPATWTMDVGQVQAKITPRTKAVMPVHIYGHPVEMGPLLDLAEQHGFTIVEDAAEAHGAEYRSPQHGGAWRSAGSFGALSCFSFYANKLVTTGEGGMVLTDDHRLAERCRLLRNLAFRPDRRFLHDELGFNFRITNVQAAIGLAQVERIDATVARKREIARRYTNRLRGLPVGLPVEREWARSVWWMYGLIVDESTGLDAVALADRLRERDVETRPFFLGMHAQPALRARGWFDGQRYPVADRLARQGLYLPSGVGLTNDQIDEVCDAVRAAVA